MESLPMLANIVGQPASHRAVLAIHTGSGKGALDAAAALLRGTTGRILVSGMGASFFAAIPFVQLLQAMGKSALAVESSELLYAMGKRWQQGDCAILISRSGGSVEVLKLAESMRADGVAVIGVSNVANSSLTQLAEATMLIGSLPDELIAVQSYTGTVLALLLLAQAAYQGTTARLEDELSARLPLLDRLIEASLANSDDWEPVLAPARPLYLLGRGRTAASLQEGSLLMHETAKAAAIAMASGQFRHGPVEVVDTNFRAIVLGTEAETRRLDSRLALDLERMGGHVLWIGPQDGQGSLRSMLPWPEDIPPALLSLFDIVPLQVAALRTADWRGIVAGAFRFASEVTQDEESFPFFEARTR